MTDETARQSLARMFKQTIRDIDEEGRTGTGTPTNMLVNSPIFGHCRLVEHPADEAPNGTRLGYVELKGAPGDYPLAMWLTDKWLNRSGKPFKGTILRWFDLEMVDG